MDLTPNPIHKIGERNLYCPNYAGCLDHAVDERWSSWDCSECSCKSKRESMGDVYTVPDPDPFYELPGDIYGQVRYTLD